MGLERAGASPPVAQPTSRRSPELIRLLVHEFVHPFTDPLLESADLLRCAEDENLVFAAKLPLRAGIENPQTAAMYAGHLHPMLSRGRQFAERLAGGPTPRRHHHRLHSHFLKHGVR